MSITAEQSKLIGALIGANPQSYLLGDNGLLVDNQRSLPRVAEKPIEGAEIPPALKQAFGTMVEYEQPNVPEIKDGIIIRCIKEYITGLVLSGDIAKIEEGKKTVKEIHDNFCKVIRAQIEPLLPEDFYLTKLRNRQRDLFDEIFAEKNKLKKQDEFKITNPENLQHDEKVVNLENEHKKINIQIKDIETRTNKAINSQEDKILKSITAICKFGETIFNPLRRGILLHEKPESKLQKHHKISSATVLHVFAKFKKNLFENLIHEAIKPGFNEDKLKPFNQLNQLLDASLNVLLTYNGKNKVKIEMLAELIAKVDQLGATHDNPKVVGYELMGQLNKMYTQTNTKESIRLFGQYKARHSTFLHSINNILTAPEFKDLTVEKTNLKILQPQDPNIQRTSVETKSTASMPRIK